MNTKDINSKLAVKNSFNNHHPLPQLNKPQRKQYRFYSKYWLELVPVFTANSYSGIQATLGRL